MKSRISLLLAAWWLCSVAPVGAQSANSSANTGYGKSGGYLQFGGSAAIEDFDLPSSIDVDEGFVIDPLVGYRFNRLIAVELQGRYLHGLDFRSGGVDFDVDGWSILFNAKVFAPVDWRVQPFAKFGSGYTEIEREGTDFDDVGIHYGGGAEYYLDASVAVGVEGGRFHGVGDLDRFDYWTTGAFVKFLY